MQDVFPYEITIYNDGTVTITNINTGELIKEGRRLNKDLLSKAIEMHQRGWGKNEVGVLVSKAVI